MSTAVAKTIPIGPCNVYWGDKRLGFSRNGATFRYNKETIEGGIEEMGVDVLAKKVKESCEVDVVIADLNIQRLKYLYDQAKSEVSATALDTTNYSGSATVNVRFKDNLKLSGTAATTVSRSTYISGTVQVFKADLSVEYTKGTDWTGTASVGSVKRVTAGAIATGQTVIVEYNKLVPTKRIATGGKMADYEAPLRLVHALNDGKVLQFYAYRAKKKGASEIAIQVAAEFGGIPMTFKVLADMTQAPGQQLFHWAVEI
ncbi:MAG: hypothetical protein IMZ71_02795 [Chloroflexi bacterium]|nr:hypothetical protein [Chloroflexota bacterium]